MTDNTTDNNSAQPQDKDLAAEVIRTKIAGLYKEEPSAKEEVKVAEATEHRSKHQQFMHQLTNSGKSLAEIQTTWHEYYQALPDNEKHEVWQEFYAAHERPAAHKTEHHHTTEPVAPTLHHKVPKTHDHGTKHTEEEPATVSQIKDRIARKATSNKKLTRKQHIQSLFFGLGMGAIVLLIMLFGFFNERFIAPFISPSKAVSNTPIIIDPNTAAVGNEEEIVIPKINVEIPVVYDEPSIKEPAVQAALERGVVHYANTPSPGEKGNAVIVGHSSNNILNRGKYKFAFVLLKRLEPGDTIILTKDRKRYVYKVYEKKIVKPTDVSVLGATSKPATVTLITCDPPGTSINRLIVVAEQISPDPAKNKASTAKATSDTTNIVPGNAPTLWSRFTGWLTGSSDE